MMKIPTRNPITWLRIRRGWRRLDKFEAANVSMYRAIDLDDRRIALRTARRAARLAPTEAERDRFLRWAEALRSGHRVKRSSYPAIITTDGLHPLAVAEIDSLEPKE
jgi:hypothetical protein